MKVNNSEVLVVKVGQKRIFWWQEKLQGLLPEVECRTWDDMGNLDDITIAVVWSPEAGVLKKMKNLKLIVSIGAGVDHITKDPNLPKGVPIIKTINKELRQRMVEYIVMHTIALHRKLYMTYQSNMLKQWNEYICPPASKISVGFLGLGNMGLSSAKALVDLGYNVSSWTNSKKEIVDIKSYVGKHELDAFLKKLDILICVLPLTDDTKNILNKDLFNSCKDGISIINVGRGDHVNDTDLIDSIKKGKVSFAVLDVFRKEPLPSKHTFWGNEKVIITMHTAGFIDPDAGGKVIATNIQDFLHTGRLNDEVDVKQGY